MRKIIIKIKTAAGRVIGKVKGGVAKVKEKGEELVVRGKEKVIGFFKKRWRSFAEAPGDLRAGEKDAPPRPPPVKRVGTPVLVTESQLDYDFFSQNCI